jgi:glycosyltransferase involved in cell wall biosynthesis
MHVLMLTRRVDREDWLTGFAHTWIDRLARHPEVERLDVICLERGAVELPPNVQVASMGKERGYDRLRELGELRRALREVIGEVDVIFGHMIPRYALVAAPWALAHRVPIVQWYTHRQATAELRLVNALAARIVSATPESYPLPGPKVVYLGHGIDLDRFCPLEEPVEEPLIVSVGRLSPIKHYEALIEAVALLAKRPGCAEVRAIIAGGTTPQHGEAYLDQLRALARARGAADRVEFAGPVPHHQIHELYQRAAISVNLCPTGGADKAVLESMACGLPVVVRNETFLPLLGDEADELWSSDLDPEQIADRLGKLLDKPAGARREIGARLRERVRTEHDLDGLIDRLVNVLSEAARERGKLA